VKQVTLPTLNGDITVLPGHEALMSVMTAGEVIVWHDKGEERLIVSPGFVQIVDDVVTVLVDSAVREESLSEQKAIEARKAAEAAMSEALSETEVAMTLGTIERTIMEMKAIQRGRGGARRSHVHRPESGS
jgi:F-type H+-transporting ATPase subunit epsilon